MRKRNTTLEKDEIIYFEQKFLQNKLRLTAISRGCKNIFQDYIFPTIYILESQICSYEL
jgi:hypothetical protein